jgi:hypothetical protein
MVEYLVPNPVLGVQGYTLPLGAPKLETFRSLRPKLKVASNPVDAGKVPGLVYFVPQPEALVNGSTDILGDVP